MVRFSPAASWLLVSSLTLLSGPVRALKASKEEEGSTLTTTTPNNVGEDGIGAWSWPDAIAKSVGHEPLNEWKEYRFKDPFGGENNGKDGVRGPKVNADQVNWSDGGGGASSLRGKWWPSITCPYGGAMQVEYYGREQCIGVGQGICKDGWQFGINHYGDNTYLMLWREDNPAYPVFRSFPGATQLCIGEQYPNVAYLRVTYDDCLYYLIGPGAGDANNLARLKIVPDTQKYKRDDVIVKFRDGPGDSNTLWQIFANGASMTNRYALWYNPTNVDTFSELKKRIAAADDAKNPDTIVLCPNTPIVFEDIIDFSDKYFKIECLGGSGCVFDLDGYSFVTTWPTGADFDVEFKGITIENGSSSKGRDPALYGSFGGAILLRGDPTLPEGVKPENSTLTLTSCTFRNNTSISDSGAIDSIGATIIATDTVFSNNDAGRSGGAIWSSGFASFVGCDFIGNAAGDVGGAITIYGVGADFDRCKFIGNKGFFGGGIYSNAKTTVKSSTLFKCNSAIAGGAIFHVFGAQLSMDDVEVSANTASGGGGIYVTDVLGSITSDFNNCRFYQNTANEGGGAIYFDGPNQSSTLTDTVFQNNTASASTSDDISNANPSSVACSGNCFCDADNSNGISTNVLSTTCAGDGVGSTCPGCNPPAAPIVCDGDNGSLGASTGVVTRAGGNSPPTMDIKEMVKNSMEMIERKRSGQNRRH